MIFIALRGTIFAMINIGAALFSRFTIDTTCLWEKGTSVLDKLLHSPWTKWGAAGGGACLAAFAIARVRSHLVSIDEKLAHPSVDTLLELFKELVPLRGHWFFNKRWTALKTSLENDNNLVEQFCEKIIAHQIADPKNDWLSPASELFSIEQLSRILKVSAEELKKHASDLAISLENPPEKVSSLRTTLKGYANTSTTYLGQALHSFASTFLRAHSFSSEQSNSLVDRPEAGWHLTNFYQMIEKPFILLLAIYTFLQPKTKFWWIPYAGCLCSAIAAISLIKFFNVFLEKKKAVLSHDLRNLSEEARQGTLPVPLASPKVLAVMGNSFSPLNKDSPSILLIGPSGVGKDAQLHAFIHAILQGQFPLLKDVEIHTTNAAQLDEGGGGTNHLYFSRIQILSRDLKGQEDLNLIFINEIHTLNPRKDQINTDRSKLGQQFKTLLETGQLHVIGATTLQEYKDHIEWDVALDRRFVKIFLIEVSDCTPILETYLAEKYPTVTVEKAAIQAALEETNKIDREIVQPAKAKKLLAQAARSVIGNFGKQEEELLEQSAKLAEGQRLLASNASNSVKAQEVAELARDVKKRKEAITEKRKDLDGLANLKNDEIKRNKQLIQLAHRISLQPEKSDLEKKVFLLVKKLLAHLKTTTTEKETELTKKGIRIIVDAPFIRELVAKP